MVNWEDPTTWSVLVVDDEPDNLEVAAEVLAYMGLTVQTATNGIEGLQKLQSFDPTLILLDLSMPGMNGWEMRMQVKSDPKTQHIPIVALTAHAMVADMQRALEVGFDGYMTKPINVRSFLQDLRAAVDKFAIREMGKAQ